MGDNLLAIKSKLFEVIQFHGLDTGTPYQFPVMSNEIFQAVTI